MPATTSQPATPAANRTAEPRGGLLGFFDRFAVLKTAQRELWLTFAIKFVMVAAYSVTNKTLVLWLSSDFGYSDQKAGMIVGWIWAPAMTLITIMVGSLTDTIGLRKTFFLGAWICLVSRAVMVFSTVKWLALGAGLFPLAVGEALGNPVLIAAGRKFSTTRQRSISFSLLYAFMNVGFWASAEIFDFLRRSLGEHGHFDLFGVQLSTYRALFLASLILEIIVLPLIYFIRKGAEATDEGLKIVPETDKYPGRSFLDSFWLTVRDTTVETGRLFKRLLSQSGFYRLLGFLLLIGFLKVIVMQMDYVFPKFAIRELGDGSPVGRLSSINYILIIILVPLVGVLTQKFSAYRMVVIGGLVCASSVFLMALPTGWFQGVADWPPAVWMAHTYLSLSGPVHPYYIMIAIYVAVFSLGEAFYSPRVYEYAAAIAPKGQEASYGALSYIPLLLGKLLVGCGGWLLAMYCPEHGPRRSATMWLIFALAATVAPIGLLVLRKYIRVHEAGRQE
ncbi:MAG TPA: MFS transporter [Candidatus Dormibacteraeota bacterium]|nr:MFS transporter [Candidatus Dormibacteraeota bacterium]